MTKALSALVGEPRRGEHPRFWGRGRRRYDKAMNSLMTAALPATGTSVVPLPTGETGPLPAGLTPADGARIAEALAAARTEDTRRVYALVWGQWQRWCAERGLTPMPADPLAVCAYLTERAEAGRATGTLDMACTVIRHVHRTCGAADPIASEALRQIRRGLRAPTAARPAAWPDR